MTSGPRGRLSPPHRSTRLPQADRTGADTYMAGLIAYAQPIVPDNVRILASTGDERNAVLTLTMTMAASTP